MSDQFSNKCEICQNDILGRHVKAAEAIQAGDTLLLEKPLLIAASRGDKRCSNCFRFAQQYCSKCSIAPLCLDCSQHSDFDCKTLSSIASIPGVQLDIVKRFPATYDLLKCLLLHENPETRDYFEDFLKMQSHLEERRKRPVWQEDDKEVIQPLLQSNIVKELGIADRINEDFLQHICGIWDVNSYEIRAPDSASMRGLYLNGSLMTHNCCPNTNQAIDDQYRIKLYANRDIAKDEIITISYTNLLLGTEERRHILQEGKYFHCTCERCEDPTELGTHMSSFVCPQCAANNAEGLIVKLHDKNIWKCLNCEYSLKNEHVQNILEQTKEEVFQSEDDLRSLEYLLIKLNSLMHKNHYIIIDVKQNIANILRSVIRSSLQRPGRLLYERKVRLCQELVMLLHTIQPGLSRLKGIAMYEMATASAELYRLRFGEDELSAMELQDYLRQCESMYKESIRLLIYEPSETPEGQLVKSMLAELRDLRNDIQLLDKPLIEECEFVEE